MSETNELSLEEAAAALAVMAAGRRAIPPRKELQAIVAAKRRSGFTPPTAKLFSDIERATDAAKRSSDPIARASAELVAAMLALVRHEIEQPVR